jgi:hypothetical protein
LAFLDEDELAPAEPGVGTRGSDPQRQIMVRRVVALGVGVVILILLLLGIRGCLDARKERGFENYVRDLGAIVAQSNQLSEGFFARLESPPRNLTELSLQAEISADRGTAEGLLQRVEGLDTPDELAGAHAELEQAFELRRDALAGIAEEIPSALSNNREEALDAIAADMKTFLASDVLYERSRVETQAVLSDEGIAGEVPASIFVPEEQVPAVLDPLELSSLLSGVAGDAEAAPGVHGLALLSTTVNPGGVALTPDTSNTVTLDGTPELDVEVQNQGDTEETDVVVTFELTGGPEPISGEGTIDRIDSQGVETVTLGFEAEPPTDTELTLEVTVQPVLGEEIEDNNTSTYPVTFG